MTALMGIDVLLSRLETLFLRGMALHGPRRGPRAHSSLERGRARFVRRTFLARLDTPSDSMNADFLRQWDASEV